MLRCLGTCVGAGVGRGWGRVARPALDPRFYSVSLLVSSQMRYLHFWEWPLSLRLPDLMTGSQSVWREGHSPGSTRRPIVVTLRKIHLTSFSPSGIVEEWQLGCWNALKILLVSWFQARWAEAQSGWRNADPLSGWPGKEVDGFHNEIPSPAQSTRGGEIIQGPETLLWLEQNPMGPHRRRTCLIWSNRTSEWVVFVYTWGSALRRGKYVNAYWWWF